MHTLSPAARRLIAIVVIIVLFLPVVLLILRLPAFSTRIQSLLRGKLAPIASDRYSVVSEVPGYSITLLDIKYLDYITAKMNVFTPRAIVDPRAYYGLTGAPPRFTVSRIRFVLVPVVDKPVSLMATDDKPSRFLGKGDYIVENDTLVVRVALDLPELQKNIVVREFSSEDTFLRTALWAVQYASGYQNQDRATPDSLGNLLQDMKDNLYTGLFIWPIRIEKVTE